jgi:peptide/nickel transport system substrate-binding protein
MMRCMRFLAALLLASSAFAFAQVPTIVSATFRDVRSLDPGQGSSTPDRQLLQNIFSGLVRYAPDGDGVVPDLATHWEISDDGLRYTFFLRRDAQWHGGYGAFTADDVRFTFDHHRDPASGSRWRGTLAVIDTVNVIDDHTVEIILSAPSAPFMTVALASLAGLMMNERAVADAGSDLGSRPIGTGPYRLSEFEPRVRYVLEAHDGYHRGRPAIERIVWNVIPDESVQALALQNGDLNYMIVRDLEAIAAFEARGGITITATPATAYYGVVFNTQRPATGDVRVRQAIAHAIDKALFVETVLEGLGQVLDSVIPAGMLGHTPDVPTYAFDPARARELLAEAGYASGLTLNAIYTAGDAFVVPLAEVLQSFLADVGVTLLLQPLEAAALNQRRAAYDFDLHVGGPARAEPDEILSERFLGRNVGVGPNYSQYDAIDEAIDAQRIERDPAERLRQLHEIQRRLAVDLPELPVYQPLYVTVHADYLTGDRANTSNWMMFFDEMAFTDLSRCRVCR